MAISTTPENFAQPHIYQVSELNAKIKTLLEESYPFVWISGEISNFRKPSSGHFYFSLKDRRSQIAAVMFRNQTRTLTLKLEDGLSIVGLGRLGVYEPRGSYQLILEYIEPKGIGSLQVAFEKLKRALADEGLFDARHKRPLPILPRKISVVTSPNGAAIRDFINVARRRFPNLTIEVVAVVVQGERAPAEIAAALRCLNDRGDTDLIVLARGGGSIEDLSAFNDETVARTIFASVIPVVSAIGHETDYTIADFVADRRAPTPSAAAEITVPSKAELRKRIFELKQKLHLIVSNKLEINKKNFYNLNRRIVHPQRRLADLRLRLDDLLSQVATRMARFLSHRRERVAYHRHALRQAAPDKLLKELGDDLKTCQRSLERGLCRMLADRRSDLAKHAAMLDALNPMAILKRGYSITRILPGHTIVRAARQVDAGQSLEILLGQGRLQVAVETARESHHPIHQSKDD